MTASFDFFFGSPLREDMSVRLSRKFAYMAHIPHSPVSFVQLFYLSGQSKQREDIANHPENTDAQSGHAFHAILEFIVLVHPSAVHKAGLISDGNIVVIRQFPIITRVIAAQQRFVGEYLGHDDGGQIIIYVFD